MKARAAHKASEYATELSSRVIVTFVSGHKTDMNVESAGTIVILRQATDSDVAGAEAGPPAHHVTPAMVHYVDSREAARLRPKWDARNSDMNSYYVVDGVDAPIYDQNRNICRAKTATIGFSIGTRGVSVAFSQPAAPCAAMIRNRTSSVFSFLRSSEMTARIGVNGPLACPGT